jgi:hypothetical protein
MLGIIDRFEGNLVVVELQDKRIINIEKSKIPIEAVEGDVLNIDKDITIDLKETENRKKHMEDLTGDIWK